MSSDSKRLRASGRGSVSRPAFPSAPNNCAGFYLLEIVVCVAPGSQQAISAIVCRGKPSTGKKWPWIRWGGQVLTTYGQIRTCFFLLP
jgi:hypothetical protein